MFHWFKKYYVLWYCVNEFKIYLSTQRFEESLRILRFKRRAQLGQLLGRIDWRACTDGSVTNIAGYELVLVFFKYRAVTQYYFL